MDAPARIAFLGTYPPRRCGIAAFTSDLAAGMLAADETVKPLVVAVTDEGSKYEYAMDVEYEIRQGTKSNYARAAELVDAYTRGRGGGGSSSVLLVGVNCRDLGTLEVVPGRLEALAARLPAGVPHVAESGVRDGEDAARLVRAGYDVALVGGALMQSADPGALARSMLAAGRAAAAPRRSVAGAGDAAGAGAGETGARRTCGSRSAG